MTKKTARRRALAEGKQPLAWIKNLWPLGLFERGRLTELDMVRYGDGIALGKSPSIQDLKCLERTHGFRAILNLNTEGEPGQILSPNVEATWAHTFAMQHERVSVDQEFLWSVWVDEFLAALQGIAKPVYVHSLEGRRAAAFLTIHLALACRVSGEEALSEAKSLGIDCNRDRLQQFVRSEVDKRTSECAPAKETVPAGDAAPSLLPNEPEPPLTRSKIRVEVP